MFISFFYLLRARGLPVSLNEWMTLTQALDMGLCRCSFSDFYYLCRSILVKSESDFDKFDVAFLEYFKELENYAAIPDELMRWLNDPVELAEFAKKNDLDAYTGMSLEEILKLLDERLKEQDSRHDGGSRWVGTGGQSPFGNSGFTSNGIRIGGESVHRSALMVAGERTYRDFRNDNLLDTRQFQMAFRRLRQFSSQMDGPKTEFNVEKSIAKTCDEGGLLNLVFERPRQNTVKLLLLMDSGGSMYYYSRLSSMLFQAVEKSSHFKDVKVYYFHNCVYDNLYTEPDCYYSNRIGTEWVLRNLSSEYKLIFIGDAAMAPAELLERSYYYSSYSSSEPGIEWLRRLKRKYSHCIWLNPSPEWQWEDPYWGKTVRIIRDEITMFPLSVQGLEDGMKALLVNR